MSTLRLILTRHAKSSWDDPTMADHDRPLNARGLRSAGLWAGGWPRAGMCPTRCCVPTRLRTRQTWDRIAPQLGGDPQVKLKPALYHAGPDVMLAVLRGAKSPVVMMLGHNPGMPNSPPGCGHAAGRPGVPPLSDRGHRRFHL
jgi:phosphohistidine phosphatase